MSLMNNKMKKAIAKIAMAFSKILSMENLVNNKFLNHTASCVSYSKHVNARS